MVGKAGAIVGATVGAIVGATVGAGAIATVNVVVSSFLKSLPLNILMLFKNP